MTLFLFGKAWGNRSLVKVNFGKIGSPKFWLAIIFVALNVCSIKGIEGEIKQFFRYRAAAQGVRFIQLV